MLYYITNIINAIGLALSVWLGIYLVTHSPRSKIAWLTSLTLWSVAGLYLNILLALNPPPIPENAPSWIFLFFPFWPQEALISGWPEWLQGWLVIPAIAFWHHVTILMRPGRMTNWRLARVLLGYAVSLAAIYVMVNTPLMFSSVSGDPLFLTTLKPGQLYPVFLLVLLAFVCMSFINLISIGALSLQPTPAQTAYHPERRHPDRRVGCADQFHFFFTANRLSPGDPIHTAGLRRRPDRLWRGSLQRPAGGS